nr:P-loop domain-containing protein [uncultured Acetatifactor sp.]
MNKFKQICMKAHTEKKEALHNLYTDRHRYLSSVSSSEQPVEDEKLFHYRNVVFQFCGTGFRTMQQMILFIWIPETSVIGGNPVGRCRTAYEDWLLRLLSEAVNELSDSLQNDHKDAREKTEFSMQTTSSVVTGRNGCLYAAERHAFRLRINFRVPLINGNVINGKSTYRETKNMLDCICDRLEAMDRQALSEHVRLYEDQLEIRDFLRESGLAAFVADGSVLPRQADTDAPMEGAVPFRSPESLRVTLTLSDGKKLTGMGLRRGITVITGGGYSGKSTLLDSLEQGIYFHVKGDGREYVATDETACKVYAEDGRVVSDTDISPFFTYLPGDRELRAFRTHHASGSVSQAVNIVEAAYGGSRCLLIDEDTSATNFMIRDEIMRSLVKKEPIIPYTDRILELKEQGISTILVIGGSGEYLKYADHLLLLEDYHVLDATEELTPWRQTGTPETAQAPQWMRHKTLPSLPMTDLFFGERIEIENAKYIKIGGCVADITRLTALADSDQINSLTWLLENLLGEKETEQTELRDRCQAAAGSLLSDTFDTVLASRTHQYELWLEEVRGLDLLMAACRLRGC